MSNTSPLVTKKSLGLAGIAALGACAACCAVPLLAATGIGGAALSALAGYIRPGADLVLAGGVGAGVLAVVAFRERARRAAAACDPACDVTGGCGCGPGNNAKSRQGFASVERAASCARMLLTSPAKAG
jgi:hypothetical protein